MTIVHFEKKSSALTNLNVAARRESQFILGQLGHKFGLGSFLFQRPVGLAFLVQVLALVSLRANPSSSPAY